MARAARRRRKDEDMSWLDTIGSVVGSNWFGPLVSGAAGVYSAQQQGQAAEDAANAQRAALEQQMNVAQGNQQAVAGLYQPYLSAGLPAVSKMSDLLGLGSGGAGAMQTTLESVPGYQFTVNQGLEAAKRRASQTGRLNSGSLLNELTKLGQGYASQNYGNYLGQLGQMANLGLGAAGSTAGAYGQSANTLSSLLGTGGNIGAQQAISGANASGAGLQSIVQALGQYQQSQQLSDMISKFKGSGGSTTTY